MHPIMLSEKEINAIVIWGRVADTEGCLHPDDLPVWERLNALAAAIARAGGGIVAVDDPICRCGQPKSIHGDIEFIPAHTGRSRER